MRNAIPDGFGKNESGVMKLTKMRAFAILTVATFFIYLTLSNFVFAQEAAVYHRKWCIDDTTLRWIKYVTIHVAETNTTRTMNVTEDQICTYGCQNDECLQPPWIMWAIVFGIVIIMVILYLIFRPR